MVSFTFILQLCGRFKIQFLKSIQTQVDAPQPIYIVKDNVPLINDDIIDQLDKKKMKWNNLISGSLNKYNDTAQNELAEGVIEFIDVQEEDNCMIAINQDKLIKNSTKTLQTKTYSL